MRAVGFSIVPQDTNTAGTGASRVPGFHCTFSIALLSFLCDTYYCILIIPHYSALCNINLSENVDRAAKKGLFKPLFLIVISVKETVDHSVLLVGNDLVQLYILNAAEDIHNNLRISFVKVGDELLYLLALGTSGAVRIAGRAGIREPARALNEMQIVVLCPVLYFVLAYEVHRADKLHSRELREELGIRARPSEFVLLFRRKVSEDNIFHGKRFLNNELKWVFLYKGALADTSIHFEEEEISGVEWQNAVSIRKALEKKDPGYCIDLQEFREVQTCAGDILP